MAAGAEVVEVGAGNSSLAAALAADGCGSVVATDLSSVVIEAMRRRPALPGLSYQATTHDMRSELLERVWVEVGQKCLLVEVAR